MKTNLTEKHQLHQTIMTGNADFRKNIMGVLGVSRKS